MSKSIGIDIVICVPLCQKLLNACSHAQTAFDNQVKLHGIELYYYKNLRQMFGNVSKYPSTVAYNAYDYKYGMLNLSAILGKYG